MRRDRGVALLLALLVLMILIILVGQMVVAAGHNRSVAENASADLLNSYGVKAGYYQVRLYLEADAERGMEVDSVNELWASPIEFPLGRAAVRARVEDAGSKIDAALVVDDKGAVNQPVLDQIRRLLVNLGHPEEVAWRILDYQDADTRGDFETGARNERMNSLDELERISGIDRGVLYGNEEHPRGILRFLTLWPSRTEDGSGLININTAPREVLQALDDEMTEQTAIAIVDSRSQRGSDGAYQHFKSPQDLASVSGMTPEILHRISPRVTVKASFFEIHSRSAVGPVEKAWLYVARRASERGGTSLTLVAQQRETEARAVKPPETEEEQ